VIIKIQYIVTYTPPTSIKIKHDNDYEILYGIHKRGNKQEYSEKYAENLQSGNQNRTKKIDSQLKMYIIKYKTIILKQKLTTVYNHITLLQNFL